MEGSIERCGIRGASTVGKSCVLFIKQQYHLRIKNNGGTHYSQSLSEQRYWEIFLARFWNQTDLCISVQFMLHTKNGIISGKCNFPMRSLKFHLIQGGCFSKISNIYVVLASGFKHNVHYVLSLVLWAEMIHWGLLWFTHTDPSGCCHGFVASLGSMFGIHSSMLEKFGVGLLFRQRKVAEFYLGLIQCPHHSHSHSWTNRVCAHDQSKLK